MLIKILSLFTVAVIVTACGTAEPTQVTKAEATRTLVPPTWVPTYALAATATSTPYPDIQPCSDGLPIGETTRPGCVAVQAAEGQEEVTVAIDTLYALLHLYEYRYGSQDRYLWVLLAYVDLSDETPETMFRATKAVLEHSRDGKKVTVTLTRREDGNYDVSVFSDEGYTPVMPGCIGSDKVGFLVGDSAHRIWLSPDKSHSVFNAASTTETSIFAMPGAGSGGLDMTYQNYPLDVQPLPAEGQSIHLRHETGGDQWIDLEVTNCGGGILGEKVTASDGYRAPVPTATPSP